MTQIFREDLKPVEFDRRLSILITMRPEMKYVNGPGGSLTFAARVQIYAYKD